MERLQDSFCIAFQGLQVIAETTWTTFVFEIANVMVLLIQTQPLGSGTLTLGIMAKKAEELYGSLIDMNFSASWDGMITSIVTGKGV